MDVRSLMLPTELAPNGAGPYTAPTHHASDHETPGGSVGTGSRDSDADSDDSAADDDSSYHSAAASRVTGRSATSASTGASAGGGGAGAVPPQSLAPLGGDGGGGPPAKRSAAARAPRPLLRSWSERVREEGAVAVTPSAAPDAPGDLVRSVQLWRATVTVQHANRIPNMDVGGLGRSDPYGGWTRLLMDGATPCVLLLVGCWLVRVVVCSCCCCLDVLDRNSLCAPRVSDLMCCSLQPHWLWQTCRSF